MASRRTATAVRERGGAQRSPGRSGAGSGAGSGEAPALRVRLLGEPRIEVAGREVAPAVWRLRKARALVELLALAPGHRLRRERLEALLWRDHGPSAAANNLRTTLHAARHALDTTAGVDSAGGAGWIDADREWIWLSGADRIWIDVGAFEAAAEAALRDEDPEACWRAAALYGGDLAGDDEHGDAVAVRRAVLRGRYLEVLARAARLHEERLEPERAIAALARVVDEEPAHEAAHAGLMRLYARQGDRHRAVRQYQLLRETLRRAWGTEPGAEANQLYEQVLAWRFAWAAPSSPSSGAEHIEAVVAVGHRPLALAVNAPEGLLFVGCSGGREVWGIDVETLEVRASSEVSDFPHSLAIHPVAQRVYVACYTGRRVLALDGRTGEEVGASSFEFFRFPRGVAVDRSTGRVYVTTRRNKPSDHREADALVVLDGETLERLATVEVGEMPMGVVVDEAAHRAYVVNGWTETVSVVDLERNETVASVRVGVSPFTVAQRARTGRLYVTNQTEGTVSVIDTARLEVVATVPVGRLPYGIAIDEAADLVYVANAIDGTLSVLDAALDVVLATVPVGLRPSDVVLSPTGDRLFVACLESDTLVVLSVQSLRALRSRRSRAG